MDKESICAGELRLISDHLRLLATLMNGLTSIQKQEQNTLSQVLLDLAMRLERFQDVLNENAGTGE
jgi:hypothetical protein